MPVRQMGVIRLRYVPLFVIGGLLLLLAVTASPMKAYGWKRW